VDSRSPRKDQAGRDTHDAAACRTAPRKRGRLRAMAERIGERVNGCVAAIDVGTLIVSDRGVGHGVLLDRLGLPG